MPRRNIRVPVTEERLRHVVTHMRKRDADEIYALRWDDDPEQIVRGLLPLCGAMCWIWERDGVPVSVQGVIPARPGVWEVFAFGTDDWPRVVLDMTRHARSFIIPALLRAGFRRAECRALASHTDSRKWIEALGAVEECVLERYGRADETFVAYVWWPERVHRRRR
jgi:hypothetical protein